MPYHLATPALWPDSTVMVLSGQALPILHRQKNTIATCPALSLACTEKLFTNQYFFAIIYCGLDLHQAIMYADKNILEQLISNEQRAIRYYLCFSIGLVILGILVILVTLYASGLLVPDAVKVLFAIGGGFISSLSTFQIKELLNCRGKVEILQTLKAQLANLDKTRIEVDDETRKRIDNLVWKVVEKTALG
jgi:hypothetical protein